MSQASKYSQPALRGLMTMRLRQSGGARSPNLCMNCVRDADCAARQNRPSIDIFPPQVTVNSALKSEEKLPIHRPMLRCGMLPYGTPRMGQLRQLEEQTNTVWPRLHRAAETIHRFKQQPEPIGTGLRLQGTTRHRYCDSKTNNESLQKLGNGLNFG